MKPHPSFLPRAIFAALGYFATVASAQVVYTDFADIGATGTGQAIAVHFGDSQGAAGSVNAFSFGEYANQISIPGDAIYFYWHDGTIVVHANSSGFTGLNYNAHPPGYPSILEVDRLDAGELPSDSFANDLRIIAHTNDWATTTGYVGVRFYMNSEWSELRYGWLRLTLVSGALTLHDMAYDATGAILPAGAIPEPSTTAMVTGLVSLVAIVAAKKRLLRRRT